MQILKLVIQNFRSYYGEKVFEFKKGLNLILGSNGDGKTTFFDAMEFALTELPAGYRTESLKSCVSAKMFAELKEGEKGQVKVTVLMKDNGGLKKSIEHVINVQKEKYGEMKILGHNHVGYMQMANGLRKDFRLNQLLEGERLFPAIIKKYSLFKGESALNIFDDKTTLKNLIDLFSDIKDLKPFKEFCKFADETSSLAVSNAQKKNKQTSMKAAELLKDRQDIERWINQYQSRLEELQETYSETKRNIESIEADFDTIELVHNMQQSIKDLEYEAEREKEKLNEEYSTNLLDRQWILSGIMPTLELYAEKMNKFSEQKRTLENLHREEIIKKRAQKEAEAKTIEQLKDELSQLPWYIPDVKTMQSMLVKHRCLVCGTPAPEGSDAYKAIERHLEDALDHIHKRNKKSQNDEENDDPIFKYRNVENIHQMSIQLYQYGMNPNDAKTEIDKIRKQNEAVYNRIDEINSQIEKQRTKIAQILAQSNSGNDIGNMANNWTNIKHWFSSQEATGREIDKINRRLPELKADLKKNIAEYKRAAGSTAAQEFVKFNDFFRLLNLALENAEDRSLEEFLNKLSEAANNYLEMLNVDDFTGVIDIKRSIRDNTIKVKLIDSNGKSIENPNTSLYTTMHLSVLFAISELTKDNFDTEYPMILDAPTSSFDEGKDKTFYQVMTEKLNKQCIVVTKSYLVKDDAKGEFVVDQKSIDKLLKIKEIPIYRIEKKEGFDKKDLTSIETVVKPLY